MLGTYAFSSFTNFALGIFDSFSQAAGNPNFTFNVPYIGFYVHDTYQATSRLTLDLGLREDFQVYPQPAENPAFPLTGQFPNQYQRVAPRFGFAWQPLEKTVVRGGFGVFYENFNGLNYRNTVITNGVATQQSSALVTYDPTLAPNHQAVVFPNRLSSDQVFNGSAGTLPDISLIDPHFRDPEVLQASLQIEREILPETVFIFALTERQSLQLQVQAFNLFNHPNYYVQNGNGVNVIQYTPTGPTCGDGHTLNQACYLLPSSGFGTLQVISPLNGPRVPQFAFKYNF